MLITSFNLQVMSALGQKRTCAAHKLMSANAKSGLMHCSKMDRYSITSSAATIDPAAR